MLEEVAMPPVPIFHSSPVPESGLDTGLISEQALESGSEPNPDLITDPRHDPSLDCNSVVTLQAESVEDMETAIVDIEADEFTGDQSMAATEIVNGVAPHVLHGPTPNSLDVSLPGANQEVDEEMPIQLPPMVLIPTDLNTSFEPEADTEPVEQTIAADPLGDTSWGQNRTLQETPRKKEPASKKEATKLNKEQRYHLINFMKSHTALAQSQVPMDEADLLWSKLKKEMATLGVDKRHKFWVKCWSDLASRVSAKYFFLKKMANNKPTGPGRRPAGAAAVDFPLDMTEEDKLVVQVLGLEDGRPFPIKSLRLQNRDGDGASSRVPSETATAAASQDVEIIPADPEANKTQTGSEPASTNDDEPVVVLGSATERISSPERETSVNNSVTKQRPGPASRTGRKKGDAVAWERTGRDLRPGVRSTLDYSHLYADSDSDSNGSRNVIHHNVTENGGGQEGEGEDDDEDDVDVDVVGVNDSDNSEDVDDPGYVETETSSENDVSLEQKEKLLNFIEKNREAVSPQKSKVGQKQDVVWKKIADQLNSMGNRRTIAKWRKFWMETKSKFQSRMQAINQGRESLSSLTEEDHKMMRILGIASPVIDVDTRSNSSVGDVTEDVESSRAGSRSSADSTTPVPSSIRGKRTRSSGETPTIPPLKISRTRLQPPHGEGSSSDRQKAGDCRGSAGGAASAGGADSAGATCSGGGRISRQHRSALLAFMEGRGALARGELPESISAPAWEELQSQAAHLSDGWSTDQWKKLWNDLKMRVQMKQYLSLQSGGSGISLTDEDKLILRILGEGETTTQPPTASTPVSSAPVTTAPATSPRSTVSTRSSGSVQPATSTTPASGSGRRSGTPAVSGGSRSVPQLVIRLPRLQMSPALSVTLPSSQSSPAEQSDEADRSDDAVHSTPGSATSADTTVPLTVSPSTSRGARTPREVQGAEGSEDSASQEVQSGVSPAQRRRLIQAVLHYNSLKSSEQGAAVLASVPNSITFWKQLQTELNEMGTKRSVSRWKMTWSGLKTRYGIDKLHSMVNGVEENQQAQDPPGESGVESTTAAGHTSLPPPVATAVSTPATPSTSSQPALPVASTAGGFDTNFNAVGVAAEEVTIALSRGATAGDDSVEDSNTNTVVRALFHLSSQINSLTAQNATALQLLQEQNNNSNRLLLEQHRLLAEQQHNVSDFIRQNQEMMRNQNTLMQQLVNTLNLQAENLSKNFQNNRR